MKNKFPILSLLWRSTLYFPFVVFLIFVSLGAFFGTFACLIIGIHYLWVELYLIGITYCLGAIPLWFIHLYLFKKYWEEPKSLL